MIGYWTHFHAGWRVAVIALGGVLGVMYSVPLRRALVTRQRSPYPEGVAAAEVLRVGAGVGGHEENQRGLVAIIWASIVSGVFFILAKMRVVTDTAGTTFRVGAGASGVSASLSMALIGVGHLVGMAVGIAMLVGILISWVWLMPSLTALGVADGGAIGPVISDVFRHQVRFIGAGTMLVAAIWTLAKVIGPIVRGILQALAANRARQGRVRPSTSQNATFPFTIVGGTILPRWSHRIVARRDRITGAVADHAWSLVLLSLGYIMVAGLVIASITGYMAGLIGASNSPVSGVGIPHGARHLLDPRRGSSGVQGRPQYRQPDCLCAARNGCDLRCGSHRQRQPARSQDRAAGRRDALASQVALVIGVVFGALIIPPILDLLSTAFRIRRRSRGRQECARCAPGGADFVHHTGRAPEAASTGR